MVSMSVAQSKQPGNAVAAVPPGILDAAARLEKELGAKYGEAARARLLRGLRQVAPFWRLEDGDAAVFEDFVRTNFAADSKALNTFFERMESALESLDGHMLEINRDFRRQSDLDLGPVYPFDEMLAGYDRCRYRPNLVRMPGRHLAYGPLVREAPDAHAPVITSRDHDRRAIGTIRVSQRQPAHAVLEIGRVIGRPVLHRPDALPGGEVPGVD